MSISKIHLGNKYECLLGTVGDYHINGFWGIRLMLVVGCGFQSRHPWNQTETKVGATWWVRCWWLGYQYPFQSKGITARWSTPVVSITGQQPTSRLRFLSLYHGNSSPLGSAPMLNLISAVAIYDGRKKGSLVVSFKYPREYVCHSWLGNL